mmetsp:Transcript_13832/g.20122  ORF Transcript_13832/g.20122 Transcript_13832/m.20122 type:complete len:152 (-) Transcript_13832:431-886(-)
MVQEQGRHSTAPTGISDWRARSSGQEKLPACSDADRQGHCTGRGQDAMCVPQNPCKLRRPRHFSSSGIHLCSLPTVTASDRAQLERLFERVLGSSSSNEELEVASHKNKDAYVALWLYRIALDPDEGTAYTKFMRKSGIGRKYAVFYVKQR